MAKVKGDNVVVTIYDDGEWKLYGCGTSCTLDFQTSTIETAIPGSGVWATYLPVKNGATGTIEGLTDLGTIGLLSLKDLRTKQIAQTLINVKFTRTVDASTYTDEFDAYITGSSDSGAVDSVASFSVSFIVTGEILIS